MPTPNMMPKKSTAAASAAKAHQLRTAQGTEFGERVYWCTCSPQETSEGVLLITRHIQAKTGQPVLTGAKAVHNL